MLGCVGEVFKPGGGGVTRGGQMYSGPLVHRTFERESAK